MNQKYSLAHPPQQQYARFDPRYHNTMNRTVPRLQRLDKIPIGTSSTPMSVRDIDDELRKLNEQYQIKSGKPLNIYETQPKKIIPSIKLTPDNFKTQYSPYPTSFTLRSEFNPQTPKLSSQNNIKLSSIDYLKAQPNISWTKPRQSQSTGIEEYYKSQPSLTQSTSPTYLTHQQIQTKNHTMQITIKSSISQQKVGSLNLNPLPDDRYWKQIDLNIRQKTDPSLAQQIMQTDNQIIKTTKPTSEFVRIRQSPSKLQSAPQTIQQQKIYQRKPHHQRQPTRKHDLSLPKTSNLKGSAQGSSYIQVINQRNKIIVQLQSTISKLQNKVSDKQQLLQKYKFEIQKIKQNHKVSLETANRTINNLKKQIDLNDVKRHSNNMDLESKFRKINLQNQQISATNNVLQKDITNLKKQLAKKKDSQQINENMYSKLKIIITEKTNKLTQLQKYIDRMTEENKSLRKRISEIITQSKGSSHLIINQQDKNQIFNSIMKTNEQQNIRYKNNLAVKDQEIHRLEDLNRQLKSNNEYLKNQIEIQKLKRMTDLKNLETTFKIEDQVKINQINSLNKTLQSLEQKLKYIIQEDRRKDDFMVQYLRNRAETPEDKLKVQQFFKKYQMLSVNTNIIDCLKREQAQIETLKSEVRKLILKR